MTRTASPVADYLSTWEARVRAYEESLQVPAWKRVLRKMRRNRLLLIGAVLGVLLLALAFLGPLLSTRDPNRQVLSEANIGPFAEGHLLGTDNLGRDLAIRTFLGIRLSVVVAFFVTTLALVVGVVFGMTGAYLGGWADRVIGALTDFVWGFPLILVAVLLAAGLGVGLLPVILAVGIVNFAAIARVVRGEVLSLKEREFIEAARAGGLSSFRILWRHILPNILAPAFVLASYYVAVAIIAEAGLSFIGLGAPPDTPSLGRMISEGRNFLTLNHWATTVPGLTIVLLVLTVSLIGDGLRDVFDPRLRHEAKRDE